MDTMLLNRSVGGMGRLYSGELLLGEVYYNIRQGISPEFVVCSVVFVGSDVELSEDARPFQLLIEDGRTLTVTLERERANSPYLCTLEAEMLHSAEAQG